MIRLTWLPNTEMDIAKYQIWSAPDNLSFVKIAEVIHNVSDPTVFDASIGRFYYNDLVGTVSTWYKIRAEDSIGNISAFTISKQPGAPLPPVCVVFGTILKADGSPEIEAQVQVSILSTERNKSGQFVGTSGVTSEEIEVFTDDNGQWEVELIRGASVMFTIPKINLVAEVSVPDAASAELTTLL